MSKWIKTRTHEQCRSHHQKILRYYANIKEITKDYNKLLKEF